LRKITLARIEGLFHNISVDLNSILDEIPVGIIVLDQERRILLMNQVLEVLLGVSRSKVMGLPCLYVLRSRLCFENCPFLNPKKESESVSSTSDIITWERELVPVRITSSAIKHTPQKALGYLVIVEDLRSLHKPGETENRAYSFGQLIGRSPQMEKIFQLLPFLAESNSSVLITGETGTGKDLVAEAIHRASNRAQGPFIKVNCGALPETLLESEIFGHKRGAFTGATENKPGRFRLAHNGTLYLTEIGDLPVSLQVKLLTFLDDKIVYPLGSTKGFHADVRVIAATHRNLEQMVKEGTFREDLLFRLNVVRIHLPPLRERGGDIRMLLDHFLNVFKRKLRKNIKGFSSRTFDLLQEYYYPGNVRELRNIVEYAVTICEGSKILPKHLPAYLSDMKEPSTPYLAKPEVPFQPETSSEDLADREEMETWSSMEKRLILQALVKAKGRRIKAAELLGWGRSTLWRKMKQYGID